MRHICGSGFRLTGWNNPVLVSSADGVGTKLKVAFKAGKHDTVGQDLVNHCVNDIAVLGAEPLFFLDYFACGTLEPDVAFDVVSGIARGCRENVFALLGGETAEMPGMYDPGDYDLAGFIVGRVTLPLPGREAVSAGDLLVGLPSTGLHTNGYSLARGIVFDRLGLDTDDEYPGTGKSVGDVLLEVDGRLFGNAHVENGEVVLDHGDYFKAPGSLYAQARLTSSDLDDWTPDGV